MDRPQVVTRNEWLVARRELLSREKELTRALDGIAADRRRLPMVRVEKDYRFTGPVGEVGLLDLFDGRCQLVLQHFMFDPSWDRGCGSCTAMADDLSEGARARLAGRDTSFVAVSRAPNPQPGGGVHAGARRPRVLAMESTPLSQATLGELQVPVPQYDRSQVRRGIVHIGVGGFHRAHQAMYLDALMDRGEALEWGVCGVGVLEADRHMAEVTAAQDRLYTLVLKYPDGAREPKVIGSHVEYLLAVDDAEAVLDRMTDPATRIVSLTVTEGGYHVSASTGEFDPDDPDIQHDLTEPHAPRSSFGFLLEALRRRRGAGTGPFTVMSCDNIAGNGDVAHRMIVAFARMQDSGLAGWVEANVPFPNCMVDRITPRTTDDDRAELAEHSGVEDQWPVVCEPFTQWVLEDRFVAGRPAFEDVGVQMVDDVIPYELMKLRLLNASHQAIAYLGYLAGYRYAHEVAQDALFAGFTRGYMDHEGTPTLQPVPGVDLDEYKTTLIERFANPEIRDTLARLAAESSDRIPTWLVPVIRTNLADDGEIERSALVVAAWARYAEGLDEDGEPIDVVDRDAGARTEAARRWPDDPLAFLEDRDLFGDLVDDERFTTAYRAHLEALHRDGARATVEALEERLRS